jgi:hypothetical protein
VKYIHVYHWGPYFKDFFLHYVFYNRKVFIVPLFYYKCEGLEKRFCSRSTTLKGVFKIKKGLNNKGCKTKVGNLQALKEYGLENKINCMIS